MATLLLPAVVAVVVGLAAGRLQRGLRPAIATLAYTLLAGTAAVAVVAAIVVLSTLTLARTGWVADRVAWCQAIAGDHDLPAVVAVAVVSGALAMIGSVGLTAWRRRRLRPRGRVEGLVVLPTDVPTAYAVPGRGGHVVVSRGMLRGLDAVERRVLLAHERAHLRLRHDRYLWVADLSAAVLPLLAPLRDRVRFATERWADEAAAQEIGDRAAVARAICRAALLQAGTTTPAAALGLAGLAVSDRVEALLDDDAAARSGRLPAVTAAVSLLVALVASTWQLHHVLAFAAHVCRLT